MAITFDNRIKRGNVNSVWIVKLTGKDASNLNTYIRLSTSEYRDSNKYYPYIINNPSIRTSIDLKNSTSKVGNVSLQCINGKIGLLTLSQLLHLNGQKFLNKNVEIRQSFSHNNSNSDPTDVAIFKGVLTNISHTTDVVNLEIQHRKIWDKTSIPNTFAYNRPSINVPVVYGDQFSKNNSTFNTPLNANPYLHPCRVLSRSTTEAHILMPRAYTSGSDAQANLKMGDRIYLPYAWTTGGQFETTHVEEGQNVLKFPIRQHNTGIVTATDFTDQNIQGDSGRVFFQNTHLMFDEDSSTFGSVTCNSGNNHYFGLSSGADGWGSDAGDNDVRDVRFKVKGSAGHSFNIYAYFMSPTGGNPNNTYTLTTSKTLTTSFASHTMTFSDQNNRPKLSDHIGILFVRTSGTGSVVISVNDVQVNLKNTIKVESDNKINEDHYSKFEEIEEFYSGGNGLSRSYTGGSGDVSTIPEAHRDILKRFVGIDESSPEGFSALNSARSNWKIRYWLKKPQMLDEVLEQLQFEGGFIFMYKPTGEMKYIYQHVSFSGGSPSHDWNFNDKDLSTITIGHTPITSLEPSWEIKYNKLPDDKYDKFKSYSLTNDYTDNTIEKKEIKLDALCTDTGVSEFWTYYREIVSKMRITINTTIVNPAKWGVEVGDVFVIDLTNNNLITPFGNSFGSSPDWGNENFSGDSALYYYFIITDVIRNIDKVNIKAMEVG